MDRLSRSFCALSHSCRRSHNCRKEPSPLEAEKGSLGRTEPGADGRVYIHRVSDCHRSSPSFERPCHQSSLTHSIALTDDIAFSSRSPVRTMLSSLALCSRPLLLWLALLWGLLSPLRASALTNVTIDRNAPAISYSPMDPGSWREAWPGVRISGDGRAQASLDFTGKRVCLLQKVCWTHKRPYLQVSPSTIKDGYGLSRQPSPRRWTRGFR